MKTVRVSDTVYRQLARLLGEMMVQSRKPQTFGDFEEALVLPMDCFVLE